MTHSFPQLLFPIKKKKKKKEMARTSYSKGDMVKIRPNLITYMTFQYWKMEADTVWILNTIFFVIKGIKKR